MESKKENIVEDLHHRANIANKKLIELQEKIHKQKLLDEFAISAMSGMITAGFKSRYKDSEIAEWSYKLANEMMKEREKHLIK